MLIKDLELLVQLRKKLKLMKLIQKEINWKKT